MGSGSIFGPDSLGFPGKKNASRANFQALVQTESHFELEVMSPVADCQDGVTLVGGPGVQLGLPGGSVGGGLSLCAGVSEATQLRSHGLNDSQASPDDEA